jgi:phenylalanyl-tRNA synthetase beta chain
LKTQDVERDIAIVVPEKITHAEVMAAINSTESNGFTRFATLFDIYRPKSAGTDMTTDEKSLAVRLTFNSLDATLKHDAEAIDLAVGAVLVKLSAAVGGRLRGEL